MSIDITLTCDNFQLANPQAKAAIQNLIKEHMGDYKMKLESEDNDRFYLEANRGNSANVGDSYSGRVQELVDAMAPYVKEAFSVTLREDSMEDERDCVIIGGPTPKSIENYQFKQQIEQALALFSSNDDRQLAMRALLNSIKESGQVSDLVDPKMVKVFVDVEGGVVQNIYGTHPVNLTVIDFDIEGTDKDELKELPDGARAIVSPRAVDVDKTENELFYAALFDQGSKVVKKPRP